MSNKEVAFKSINDALDDVLAALYDALDAINSAETATLDLFIYDKEKAADIVVDLEHISESIHVLGVVLDAMEKDFGKME